MKEAPLHEVQASPGEMLKALREERKLSVQDIAAKLYLDVGTIEALEQDNFSALPPSTYARGYFRSYARLVGADADLIIAIYNKIAPGPPEIIPEVRHPTQISSRDKPIQVITWVIFLVIGLLVLSWLQSNYMIPGFDQPGDGSVKNAARTTAPAQTANPVTTGFATDLLADVAPEEIENQLTDSVTASELSPGPATGGELTEPVAAGADAALTDTETADDATSQSTVIGGADNSAITQGTDTLKLRLTADSWVEVIDRDGHRLYENLARTGEQISLSGAAPFAVKLGFSKGVILEFNGEPFDPAPYSRAGVASFTLK